MILIIIMGVPIAIIATFIAIPDELYRKKGFKPVMAGSLIFVLVGSIAGLIRISTVEDDAARQWREIESRAEIETQKMIAEYDSIRVEQAKQDSIFFLTTKGKRVKRLMDKYSWSRETAELILDNMIWIGMPLEGVIIQRGRPNAINMSNYGYGIQRQYVWHNYNPSCFYDDDDDGLVDAYN